MITCSMPAATASSTAYWITGLSTRGSISLGCAFVAGRKRVPQPAAGKTALRTRIEPLGQGDWVAAEYTGGPRRTLAAAGRDGRRRASGARQSAAAGQATASCAASATTPREGRRAVEVREVQRPRDEDDVAAPPAGGGPRVAAGPEHRVERAVDDQ